MGRITTTDIANQMGISRGTVSKALNNRSRIDERTRLMVYKVAHEMGYKKINLGTVSVSVDGVLSILVREQLFGDPYWSVFIKSFEQEDIGKNYKYTVNILSTEDEDGIVFPKSFGEELPAGIVTIGPISEDYYRYLQSSKIPTIYVDTSHNINDAEVFGDTLLICNREHVYEMTSHLISQGHTKLGFVGAEINCRSFQERWLGFCDGLNKNGLPLLDKFIYGMAYGEDIKNIRQWVSSLDEFPTAFVCTNDFYALTLKGALGEQGLDVPRDIALCGFDNDHRLAILYPELTTTDSYAEYMGKRAKQKLNWRLNNPDAPYEVVKLRGQIYYRNSTEGYVHGG